MVKIVKKNNEPVSFSIKGAGRFFKRLVKKTVNFAKEQLKNLVVYLHGLLSKVEDYLLGKLDDLGTWANKKIEERLPEPEPEPELIE